MMRRAAGLGGLGAEAEALQLEFLDEGVDDSYRIVLGYEVIEACGQQADLASIFSFDESLHAATRSQLRCGNLDKHLQTIKRFHTRSAKSDAGSCSGFEHPDVLTCGSHRLDRAAQPVATPCDVNRGP